jgi:hypothetical protein
LMIRPTRRSLMLLVECTRSSLAARWTRSTPTRGSDCI